MLINVRANPNSKEEKLEIVNAGFGLARIFSPSDPSPPQAGEDRTPFELIAEYTAS